MANSKYALWIGRFIVLAAILIGFVSLYSYYQHARFMKRVAALKASGELQNLDELIHRIDGPEEDAWFFIAKAIALQELAKDDIPEKALLGGESSIDETEIEKFDEFADQHSELLVNITLAANTSKMSFDPTSVQLSGSNRLLGLNSLVMLAFWKGRIQIAKEDFAGANQTAVDLLKLAELGQPTLISVLLSHAIRNRASKLLIELSSCGELEHSQLDTIDALLDDNDYMTNYQDAVKVERSFAVFHMLNPHLLEGESDYDQGTFMWFTTQLSFGPAVVVGNSYLDLIETTIERAAAPLTVQFDKRSDGKFQILSRFGEDSSVYDNLRNLIGTRIAESRSTRIHLALDAAVDSLGRDDWPQEYLLDLGLAKSATVDPFTDEPMVVRRENNRWIVYSRGVDGVDDNGDPAKDAGMLSNQ